MEWQSEEQTATRLQTLAHCRGAITTPVALEGRRDFAGETPDHPADSRSEARSDQFARSENQNALRPGRPKDWRTRIIWPSAWRSAGDAAHGRKHEGRV